MNYNEFISRFQAQVRRLPLDRSRALALDICKKLYFDYYHFCDRQGVGAPDLLLDTIRLAEQWAPGKADPQAVIDLLNQIDRITPDAEDYSDAAYAINACNAVYETVQWLQDKDPEHILNVAACWTDGIDLRIQEAGNLSEAEIDAHPELFEARRQLLEATR